MSSKITPEEEVKEKLKEYGYTPDSLEGMPLGQLKRLNTLHREFDEVEFNLPWYDGTGPCYDMLDDLLSGVSLQTARRRLNKLARTNSP